MKPPFFIPQCEDAFLLVNPRALFLYQQGGEIANSPLTPGTPWYQVDKKKLLRNAYSYLSAVGQPKNFKLLDNVYIDHMGQFEYLFTVIGCGHCVLCRNTKRIDLVNRAALETELYDHPPMYFTLTYDDAHLPRNGSVLSYNLRYTDVQKFFKRLRKRFNSKGLPTDFRYLVAGEYGKDTHRPHYHVIMWNNPYKCSEFEPGLFNQLREDVFLSWGLCQPPGFDFQQCAGGAAHYVTKYLTKQVKYADREVQPFIHTSIGNGGIGYQKLAADRQFYLDNPSLTKYHYLDLTNGGTKEISFGSYAKTVLHPSPSRMVPANVRDQYRQVCDIMSVLFSMGVFDRDKALDFLEVQRPYKSVLPIKLERVELPRLCHLAKTFYKSRYLRLMIDIACKIDPDRDLSRQQLAQYRDYMFQSLPRNDNRGSLAAKAFSIASKNAELLKREKL